MKIQLAIFFLVSLLSIVPAIADETESADDNKKGERKHVELDTTTIRSSSELPSVMAVVPWKKALSADLGGRPDKSLVDSVLAPLDPEVFRLQLDFYQQLFVAKASASADADKNLTGEN
ncbi:MAG: hypothetical protein HKM98_03840 [Gammaproteobacteria bacterium]|nr:hypothetical protein [Gammaproteobacteria bacterium]